MKELFGIPMSTFATILVVMLAICLLIVAYIALRKPIVFMEPGDVAFRSLERDAEGEFPDVHMHHEGEQSPMIWAPLSIKP